MTGTDFGLCIETLHEILSASISSATFRTFSNEFATFPVLVSAASFHAHCHHFGTFVNVLIVAFWGGRW